MLPTIPVLSKHLYQAGCKQLKNKAMQINGVTSHKRAIQLITALEYGI